MFTRTTSLLLANTLPFTALAHYKIVQNYTGVNFFDNFDFYTGPDPTNGHVSFVGDATAVKTGLANLVYYSNATNPSNVVYMGVDNSTVLSKTQGRRSIRVESVQTFNTSLVIADILHQPANICGVWPSMWMLGSSAPWPQAGEIDILEGVNDMNYSRMSLHTTSGLTILPSASVSNVTNSSIAMKGTALTTNCDVAAPDQSTNTGCAVADSSSVPSYGSAFNAIQGGVYAMEYTPSAIKIWFFPRTWIPYDIVEGHPQPPMANGSDFNAWGTPNAVFSPVNNNIINTTSSSTSASGSNGTVTTNLQSHFRDLRIIFDTTFCGDWAGKIWNATGSICAQLAPTCEEYVSQHPEAFHEAYWLIQGLTVYHNADLDGGAGAGDDDDGMGGM